MNEFNNDSIVLAPKPEWFQSTDRSNLYFPQLRYRTLLWNKQYLTHLLLSSSSSKRKISNQALYDGNEERLLRENGFMIGGTWTAFCEYPYFLERCAIFEQLYFPYDWPFVHLKVRNAVLLWARINLFAYTCLRDPNRVVILDQSKRTIVAEMTFSYEDGITLTEYIR